MSEKEEFRFSEEEEHPTEGSDEGFDRESGEPEEWQDEKKLRKALKKAERKKKGSSPRRLLLLVLLLVVLAGAAVYFFMGVPQPEPPPPPPPKVVKKQPIAVPKPPAEPEKVEAEAPPPAAQVTEDSKEAAPPADSVAESSPAQVAPEEAPAEESDTETTVPPTEGETAVDAEVVEPTGEGRYAVRAGAFLLKANLAAAMDKLARMGYDVRVEEGVKKVVMTRLRLGAFSPEEAAERMAELSPVVPGVFSLPRDGQEVVYAGSYYNLDKARRLADRLYQQGIRLEEEPVELEVPLYQISIGGFPDLEGAQEAAAKVREIGLDAYVVEKG